MAETGCIAIVGAGIVGSAVASFLSQRTQRQVILLDRSMHSLEGSTGYAPGFVGQLNSLETLTRLAKESVETYREIPNGFQTVGGLEIAESRKAVEKLYERLQLAKTAGLQANILSPAEAAALAPQFVRPETTLAALHFPDDGTARQDIITAAYRQAAQDRGVKCVEADVTGLRQREGRIIGLQTTAGVIDASTVLIATGIWTSTLAPTLNDLPIFPVAHPYAYGPMRKPRQHASPFIRWPEHYIYARDHGDFDGLGCYNHKPAVATDLGSSAKGKWFEEFDAVLDVASSRLANPSLFQDRRAYNGIFSVTPDRLPLVGRLDGVQGLWIAAAVWITHAAASARLLADLITGISVDDALSESLNPNRFHGQNPQDLLDRALRSYNDIYNLQPLSKI